MIKFTKKPVLPVQPVVPASDTDVDRFDLIRKTAADRHKKSDTDGTRRREKQTAEENRLI